MRVTEPLGIAVDPPPQTGEDHTRWPFPSALFYCGDREDQSPFGFAQGRLRFSQNDVPGARNGGWRGLLYLIEVLGDSVGNPAFAAVLSHGLADVCDHLRATVP